MLHAAATRSWTAFLRRRRRWPAIVLAALGVAAWTQPAAADTFVPTADSYVDASLSTTNFGSSTQLKADGSPVLRMYLRFNVTGSGPVPSAALRVWVRTTHETGFQVRGTSGSWTESTLNFTNAPAFGNPIASLGSTNAGAWYTVNVSDLVTGPGEVNLALTTSSSKSISIDSRETGRPPQLLIPAPAGPSPFDVTRNGTTYTATSASTGSSYTGGLKLVVESAVSELNRSGGGDLRFGAGTYDLGNTQFELYNMVGIRFLGAGMNATVIQNNMSSTSFDTEVFDISSADNVVIRDMTVSADGPFRSTSDAIDFDGGNNTLIENVKITDSRGRGIVFDGKDVIGGVPRAAENNVVRNCVITGIPSDGIELLASSFNRIEGCTITDVGGHGIQMTKSSSSSGQPHKQSNGNLITGNTIDQAGEDGVNISSGNDNEIVGNTITNSSDDKSSRDGIKIMSSDSKSCDDNLVTGNLATDNQPTKTQRYGLAITSSNCHRTVVYGNTFEGNRLGPLSDGGSNTQFDPGAPDNEPPTAPTNLDATAVSYNRIDLTWSSATDDVAVTTYEIWRDGSFLTSVSASTLTYSDTSVAPGTTHGYVIYARDAAGNVSPASNSDSATTPAGPSVFTLNPVADSYVNEASPGSNYGSSTQLRVDGSPFVNAYLRFNVQLPEGAVVSKATLRVFANTSGNVGHDVGVVSDNTWAEGGITYTNAPAIGTPVGSSGPISGATWSSVDVTSAIGPNGLLTLGMTSVHTTAVSYASRESTTQPELVIELAP